MSSNIWFTADTHFGHCNILKYCARPFKDWDEMDAIMIQRFQEVIRPGDRLYHLGDVAHSSFSPDRFFGCIGTKEIHLIWGNHDKPNHLKHPYIRSYSDLKNLHLDKISVLLCHYPMRSWASRGHGGFQLYGHVHGRMTGLGRQMDVGVDTNNFYPYEWSEIKQKLLAIPYEEETNSRQQH